MDEAEVPDELRKNYNRGRRQILDLYTRLIADGIGSGELRPVDPQLAAFAMNGMSNWTALWYSPAGRMKPAEIARDLTMLLVHGIGQMGSPGGPAATDLAPVLAGLQEQVRLLGRLIAPE